ncbi:hypothetical protein MUA02_04600 [Enterobacteriaceae bacterium H20N1]|uniref:Uncharacterized protein n=1 Tax=Dryocola boscaweniae TaxID=2925397 RepID=A0A9X3AME5_9ENTR|nr:hypothetical protein [Dryocola boscaweniae]MCT4701167.1 hypothetical protein [Dryocola boscaweniae]MCT4718328.1 hypothetical protein [Dryocola boscaweniae]
MDTDFWKDFFDCFLNSWLPGIVTFALGILYSSIVEKRKLRQKLKNDLLEIFIPVFNSGNKITFEIAENTYKKMNGTFNTYQRIYPGIFKREAEKRLSELLTEGFIIKGNINKKFFEPDDIEKLIKAL